MGHRTELIIESIAWAIFALVVIGGIGLAFIICPSPGGSIVETIFGGFIIAVGAATAGFLVYEGFKK